MKNMAILGVGQTKFGEHWTKSLRDLSNEAGIKALTDAGVEGRKIQAMFVGNMSSGKFIGQEHLGALAVDHAGLTPIPSTRCEGACASGSLAFRKALLSVASGEYDIVVAAGSEKMTDIMDASVTSTLMGAGDQEWESTIGLTFAGLYALIARAHMKQYGTTREQMAMMSVNSHKNAVHNENAQFPFAIKLDDVINSTMVANPLTLLDCSPISDGAAASIIVSEDWVKENRDSIPNIDEKLIWVHGSGQASDSLALHDRKSLTELLATKFAAKKAYEQAGIGVKDIDMVEIHDCFSINGLISLEDLGFCKKGEGGKYVEDDNISLNSTISVNTSGGLKAKGHPVGATGIAQIVEAVKQLRGTCGQRQVKKIDYAMTHNVGGTGATAVVHIFNRNKVIK